MARITHDASQILSMYTKYGQARTVDGLNSVGTNFHGFCGGSNPRILEPTKW